MNKSILEHSEMLIRSRIDHTKEMIEFKRKSSIWLLVVGVIILAFIVITYEEVSAINTISICLLVCTVYNQLFDLSVNIPAEEREMDILKIELSIIQSKIEILDKIDK